MTRNILSIITGDAKFDDRCINNIDELVEVVTFLKAQGKKIVLTQGGFDLIHIGHALYLEKAKSYGDILIVGVDSDILTKERKEPGRPIIPEDERIQVVSHIRSVDIVTLRNPDTKTDDFVKIISPDTLIISKSSNKTKADNQLEDAQNRLGKFCGKIILLEPQAITSTTAIIRKLTIDGGKELINFIYPLLGKFKDVVEEMNQKLTEFSNSEPMGKKGANHG